ncbi:hypothetical protein PG984_010516 [Apiospora sp. TS-2023a]
MPPILCTGTNYNNIQESGDASLESHYLTAENLLPTLGLNYDWINTGKAVMVVTVVALILLCFILALLITGMWIDLKKKARETTTANECQNCAAREKDNQPAGDAASGSSYFTATQVPVRQAAY